MTDGFSARNVGSGGGGDGVGKRSLLASLWSIMTILTATCFLTAFLFVLSTNNDEYYNQNNNDNGYNNNNENDKEGGSQDEYNGGSGGNAQQVAVTSRALAFSILWTSVLAALLSVFGTVILGWQSPTGLYSTCCSSSVHRTTPLGIGSFIGALLMFANLTLVCSVLFGEFEVCFCVDGGYIMFGYTYRTLIVNDGTEKKNKQNRTQVPVQSRRRWMIMEFC